MKSFLTDWRSPGKWSRADRVRLGDGASVSNQWDRNPFGLRDMAVYVAVQPGVLYWEGRPAQTILDRPLDATLNFFDGWLMTPGNENVLLWESGSQAVRAFDLRNESISIRVAQLWTEFYPWASGLHLDYFSTYLGQATGAFDAAFWDSWKAGWRSLVARLRLLRPDWKLIGQEWHETPLTEEVDGLFFERHPQDFGWTMADHDARTRTNPEDVWEIRQPERLDPAYVQNCLAWIERRGASVSFGRDSTAGKGLPA